MLMAAFDALAREASRFWARRRISMSWQPHLYAAGIFIYAASSRHGL